MSKKALLASDGEARRLTIYHEESGKTFLETRQDCDHIVRAAAMISEEVPGKEFRHVGFIPDTVLNQMLIDGSFHDPATIRRWLNNPDNAAFRTAKGRL